MIQPFKKEEEINWLTGLHEMYKKREVKGINGRI